MIPLILGHAGLDTLLIHWQPWVWISTSEWENKSNHQCEHRKDSILSLKMAPEWAINSNDCHHSDDFVLFWASSHLHISLQLMGILVAHQAFRVNTATLRVLQGKNVCLHLPAGPARDSLTRTSLGLLTAPANPALINKPANWINKQLFLFFFFNSQLACNQNVW